MKATGKPVAQIIDTTLHFERYWIALFLTTKNR